LGLQGDLTLADEQTSSQLVKIVMAADVFVSPAPGTRTDLGSLMAMASGVPVVAGRETDDFLIRDKTARICDPTSREQLAGAIKGMLDDHVAARSLAEKALGYCRDEHRPSTMVEQVASVYRQVADGHDG
jgi:glycosyltransferase involved in cell wall biosynthesis